MLTRRSPEAEKAYHEGYRAGYAAGTKRGVDSAIGMINGQDVDAQFPLLRDAHTRLFQGETLVGPWVPPGIGDAPELGGPLAQDGT